MDAFSILRIIGVISAMVGAVLCVTCFNSGIRKITIVGIVCMLLGVALIGFGLALDDSFKCNGCNRFLNAQATFCSNCGQCRDGVIVCEKCSDVVDETDNFCGKCGFQIVKEED